MIGRSQDSPVPIKEVNLSSWLPREQGVGQQVTAQVLSAPFLRSRGRTNRTGGGAFERVLVAWAMEELMDIDDGIAGSFVRPTAVVSLINNNKKVPDAQTNNRGDRSSTAADYRALRAQD